MGQLEEVNWRLNLQMGQSSQTKMKLPNAMFEFVVSGQEAESKERIKMEFSHDELYQFYNKVDNSMHRPLLFLGAVTLKRIVLEWIMIEKPVSFLIISVHQVMDDLW